MKSSSSSIFTSLVLVTLLALVALCYIFNGKEALNVDPGVVVKGSASGESHVAQVRNFSKGRRSLSTYGSKLLDVDDNNRNFLHQDRIDNKYAEAIKSIISSSIYYDTDFLAKTTNANTETSSVESIDTQDAQQSNNRVLFNAHSRMRIKTPRSHLINRVESGPGASRMGPSEDREAIMRAQLQMQQAQIHREAMRPQIVVNTTSSALDSFAEPLVRKVDEFLFSSPWRHYMDSFRFENEQDCTLDAIVLSCTQSEITNGKVRNFISRITKISRLGIKPPFWIVTNIELSANEKERIIGDFAEYNLVNQLEGIHFLSMNLSAADDVYLHRRRLQTENNNNGIKYRLGTSTGPTMMFHYMMRYFSKLYRTILLLEWDCRFTRDYWFDDFVSYTKLETFWIVGSKYKGDSQLKPYFFDHLNGVALYNVKSHAFQDYLYVVEQFHKHASEVCPWLAFDIALQVLNTVVLVSNYEYFHSKLYNHAIRHIQSMMQGTNMIANFSPHGDAALRTLQIMKRYPRTLIIHQKRGKYVTSQSAGNDSSLFMSEDNSTNVDDYIAKNKN